MRDIPLTRSVTLGATAAATPLPATPAHAAMQDRDLNGNTVVDGFYDTRLYITLPRHADVNRRMDWNAAVARAAGFSFANCDVWRLPTSDACADYNCAGSEMVHQRYVDLGNPVNGPMTSAGNFQNLKFDDYWSGTGYALDPTAAWRVGTSAGYQGLSGQGSGLLTIAVRPGDVARATEPQTYALLLVVLAALAAKQRRSGKPGKWAARTGQSESVARPTPASPRSGRHRAPLAMEQA